MTEQEQIAYQDTSLPFYNVVFAIAGYLGTLPFMKDFNNAIYTYPRSDIPNISLPAVCIYPSLIRTNGSGFKVESVIRIDVIRNTSLNNRGNIYMFHQSITERIIQSIVYDNTFYARVLQRYAPYIVLFGKSYESVYNEESKTSTIRIHCVYWFPAYKKFVEETGFMSNGEYNATIGHIGNKNFQITDEDVYSGDR